MGTNLLDCYNQFHTWFKRAPGCVLERMCGARRARTYVRAWAHVRCQARTHPHAYCQACMDMHTGLGACTSGHEVHPMRTPLRAQQCMPGHEQPWEHAQMSALSWVSACTWVPCLEARASSASVSLPGAHNPEALLWARAKELVLRCQGACSKECYLPDERI